MPDPQQQTTPTSVPAPDGGIDLSGLRVRTLGGIDLSGLRVRTLEQAQSELPQPTITPPWQDEPTLPTAPTSKLGKAYADGKALLEKYGQHFSEKVLTPFREGLDRIGDQLQQAGESGHTQSGGRLTDPTRALLSGAGTLLKQTPVGRNVKETIQMSLTPPEFGPEGKAFSKELNAWERTGKEIGTVYHGGKATVGEIDPAKLQQRDAGFYGPGFYVTKNEQYAKTYGSKVSQKTFNPDAKILDVATIHPGYENKVNPELQKEIEATQRAYLTGLPKAQKNPNLVNDYLELIDPKSKSFDLHSWIEAVNRHAEQKGYDAIRFSDGEIVVKNPKALATDLSGLRTRPVQKPFAENASEPVTVEYLHNTQKAPDLGSRFGQDVEPSGKYIIEKTPGSTTPEGWQSGKVTFNKPLIVDFGGGYQEATNWKNVLSQKYGGKTGKALSDAIRKDGFDGIITKRDGQTSEIVDLTSGKPTPQSELPARLPDKARERELNLKGLGIGLTEMDPADAKSWVGYSGQKSLKIYRGVDDPSHAIEAGDYVTTSKESAQNYGKHVQELEVSPAELRYVRGHKDGDPLKLDQGGQTELIYAPKAARKTARPQTEQPSILTPEGAQPLADKLGAKVVGSVATGKTSPDPYGINRGPKDLDLRIEKYDSKQVETAMREAGFEPLGSSVLSPAEIKASGKSFGKPGWKRVEHFENANRQKVDIWHDAESTQSTKIDLSGLRVRPVGAGRQPTNWTAFIASDGRKYRFPSDVTWEQIVKADPGAKRINKS